MSGPRGTVSRSATAAALGAMLLGAMAGLASGPVAAVTIMIAIVCLARATRRARARRRHEEVRAGAEDLLAAFAAELDAGGAQQPALRAAAQALAGHATTFAARDPGWIPLGDLAAELTGPDDPGVVLCRCEASAVRQLGIAYQVCTMMGARLAPVAAMLAVHARADAVRAGELTAALAGPRASGRLVASLPVAGIALGSLAGASPLHTLLHTPAGAACLALGMLADLVGLRWMRAFAAAVERRAAPVALDAARRGAPAGAATEHGRLIADLPLALDLVAACLRGGATVAAALAAVGTATGGTLGRELRRAAAALADGDPALRACTELVRASTPHRPFDRLPAGFRRGPLRSPRSRWTVMTRAAVAAFDRAQVSGARPAATLTRLAARARDEAHAEIIAAARRAGVLAVVPLGLCFLPAFLLLGVVPAVLGSLPGLLPA
ncbi:Flp pilus assembly protein TadB [Frankia canadensis]|uniref:Flp pilus assembly protein TadB n=1 Tax=Frankia canadensis TaxID=1836972 RepID=A0A2I2KUF3_9ACTN|nr:type II secretion system F family protein [Frankia canadensis]SNQ49291.1 Flp pilus assembly protein TadB [Frankia canadensis]SOU56581.1 Flp pilus assembly protein TadB [Frankia canadensis]